MRWEGPRADPDHDPNQLHPPQLQHWPHTYTHQWATTIIIISASQHQHISIITTLADSVHQQISISAPSEHQAHQCIFNWIWNNSTSLSDNIYIFEFWAKPFYERTAVCVEDKQGWPGDVIIVHCHCHCHNRTLSYDNLYTSSCVRCVSCSQLH